MKISTVTKSIFIIVLSIIFEKPTAFASHDELEGNHPGQFCSSGGINPLASMKEHLIVKNRVYQEFIESPQKFTRKKGKIQEGAIYNEEGNVLCILKDDQRGYVYVPTPEIEAQRKLEKENISQLMISGATRPSVALCDKMKAASKKMTIYNGDFLNRFHWSVAEGNCNLAKSAVLKGKRTWKAVKDRKPEELDTPLEMNGHHTPMYFQGFVLRNLSETMKRPNEKNDQENMDEKAILDLKAKQDLRMLKAHCNSGVGHDYYAIYFVHGTAHAHTSFKAVLDPYSWPNVDVDEAFSKQNQNELKPKLRHCLRDMLPSVLPNTKDEVGGRAFWSHTKKQCAPTHFQVGFKFGGGDTNCCFKHHP